MHAKMFKVRGLRQEQGKQTKVDLDLEFDEGRAFVIWDFITLGAFMVKARVEIDPLLLQKDAGRDFDFLYRGELVLPRPELN